GHAVQPEPDVAVPGHPVRPAAPAVRAGPGRQPARAAGGADAAGRRQRPPAPALPAGRAAGRRGGAGGAHRRPLVPGQLRAPCPRRAARPGLRRRAGFAIMAAMQNRPKQPTQPSLFESPADAGSPDQADAGGTGPGLPLPDFLPPPAQAAVAPARPAGKPPLWARLLGRLADPWLKLDIQAEPAAAGDRPVCYVLEDYGLSNALILERACREAGLPPPLQPIPGDPLGRKRAYVAL